MVKRAPSILSSRNLMNNKSFSDTQRHFVRDAVQNREWLGSYVINWNIHKPLPVLLNRILDKRLVVLPWLYLSTFEGYGKMHAWLDKFSLHISENQLRRSSDVSRSISWESEMLPEHMYRLSHLPPRHPLSHWPTPIPAIKEILVLFATTIWDLNWMLRINFEMFVFRWKRFKS